MIPCVIGAASAVDIGGATNATNGIRCNYQSGLAVAANLIRNVGSTSGAVYGIYVQYAIDTCFIFNNRVYSIGLNANNTTAVYGIRADINSGYITNIFNNMVSDLYHGRTTATSTQVIRGIAAGVSGTGTGNFIYNSVLISEDEFPSSSAMYIGGNGTHNFLNNIFANASTTGTTSKRYAIYRTTGATITSNYNDLYVTAGTIVLLDITLLIS